ncbi:MAG: SPOR domain-containing protein [Eubacteriales bacterium]|nr:SPOR domain-containing protein [Eubacteriales bacterium]
MEYRRRRRRKKRQDGVSGGAKLAAALLFAGLVVYFIGASPLADWLTGAVVTPVFSAIGSVLKPVSAAAQTASPLPTSTAPAEPAEPAAGEYQTTEIRPEPLSLYALQMGVYASRENADAQAQSLKARGAAGYVLEDAGKYRVLAAAYTQDSALQNVRKQLTLEGLESAAYPMQTQQPVLRVTATKDQTEGLEAAFRALFEAQAALGDAALRFDSESQTIDTGRAQAKTVYDTLTEAYTAFSALAKNDNAVLQQVDNCYQECFKQLESLSGGTAQSTVDFSSQMKYTHLYMAHVYRNLMDTISALS